MHKTLVVVLLAGVGCGTGASARRVSGSGPMLAAEESRDGGTRDDKATMQSCWEDDCHVTAGGKVRCKQIWNSKECGPKPDSNLPVADVTP